MNFALLVSLTAAVVEGFVPSNSPRFDVSLNLEDHIADMIDGEINRLNNKQQYHSQHLAKQREWAKLEPTLPPNFDFQPDYYSANLMDTASTVQGFSGVDRTGGSKVQRRKDEKMANDDPMRYCADRCVSTGNCDVFEDMFDLDPMQVMTFCKECVLSEDEDPCDIPGSFYEDKRGLHP